MPVEIRERQTDDQLAKTVLAPSLQREREFVRPQVFFDQLFHDLDATGWEDRASGRSLDQVSEEIDRLTERVKKYYSQLSPRGILEEADFWLGNMPPEMRRETQEKLQRLNSFGDYPLELWNKAFIVRGMIYFNIENLPLLDSAYAEPHFLLARQIDRELPTNETLLPTVPLFEPLRNRWEELFSQKQLAEDQAKYTHFLYGIKNDFFEHSEAVRIIVKRLFAEWQKNEFTGKTSLPEDYDSVRQKIEKSLEEMGLAAILAKSAWAYVGRELPDQFIRYLLRTDDRKKALQLFNDMVFMAGKNQFLYPPQLYYLFKFVLPEQGIDGKRNLWEILDELYNSGRSLSEFSGRLNFIVTADQRAEEYQSGEKKLFEGTNKAGIFLAPFSGPPIDILLKYQRWAWQGPLITVDVHNQQELLRRALAIPNEFIQQSIPYSREELLQRIGQLASGIPDDGYPTRDGVWVNHVARRLPDEAIYQEIGQKGEVTLILNQRGAILYLSNGEQLRQIYNDFRLLSKKPGSVIIFTRGVVDRLVVDLGFKRDRAGILRLAFIDRSDSYYPFNTVLEYYLKGAFPEGKVMEGETENGRMIIPHDRRRSPPPEMMVKQIAELIDLDAVSERLFYAFNKKIPDRFRQSLAYFQSQRVSIARDEIEILIKKVFAKRGFFSRENSNDWYDLINSLRSGSFLKWVLENDQILFVRMVDWLDANLPSLLQNVRSIQTLRHQYTLFCKIYMKEYFEYLLLGTGYGWKPAP